MNPKYPIYIVSKGRWKTRLTSKALERICVPYWIVIEEQELDKYAEVIDRGKILILPKEYLQKYETCDSDCGELGVGPATQTMAGGNTDEFYEKKGTLPKSKMLEHLHPDVAEVVWKFKRWHHKVNYQPFKRNRLKLKEGFKIKYGINDYGMKLKQIIEQPKDSTCHNKSST